LDAGAALLRALTKRTYTLPAEILAPFVHAVPAGNRSALVSGLLSQWLEAQSREQLRRDIIESGYEMAELYLETEREWHPLEEEVQRALDA